MKSIEAGVEAKILIRNYQNEIEKKICKGNNTDHR